MNTKDAMQAAEETLNQKDGDLIENMAALALWSYDKGREDASKVPFNDLLAECTNEEFLEIGKFIKGEIERRNERAWDRMQENLE